MKTVFVTGASSGIGFDTVRALTENKIRVIATVRKVEDVENLKKNFSQWVIPIQVDILDYNEIEKIPQILKSQHQIEEIDTLVNNAGIALAGPFLDQDFSEVERIINTNVIALMKVTQVLLPLLGAKKNSQQRNEMGKIINISSIAGKSAAPFLSIYAASKHAVEGFSSALRKEMMFFGIKVFVIGPGSIKTPIWHKGFTLIKEKYRNSIFAKPFSKFMMFADSAEKSALEVSEISDLILNIVQNKKHAFRYAPIPKKFFNWYLPLLLPQKFYNYLAAKELGLKREE